MGEGLCMREYARARGRDIMKKCGTRTGRTLHSRKHVVGRTGGKHPREGHTREKGELAWWRGPYWNKKVSVFRMDFHENSFRWSPSIEPFFRDTWYQVNIWKGRSIVTYGMFLNYYWNKKCNANVLTVYSLPLNLHWENSLSFLHGFLWKQFSMITY